MQARVLYAHVVELDRRIKKTDAKATRIHGGRKCGKHFWCGGFCDKVRDLMEIREEKLKRALALMAAEDIALEYGLNDDVLRAIVDTACENTI